MIKAIILKRLTNQTAIRIEGPYSWSMSEYPCISVVTNYCSQVLSSVEIM